MEERPIIYNYYFDELQEAMMEAHAKNGRSIKSLKRYCVVPSTLLLLLVISIFISFPLPTYSFLIVIFLLLFLGSLFYIFYFGYELHKVKKGIKTIKKRFEKFQYYKVVLTENDITIETAMDKNIQKWQEVNDVSFEGNLCSFKNGSTTYFFVVKSMLAEDVEQLKELVLKKSQQSL